MTLATLAGLDHLVIAVRDLNAAAGEWAALGFEISPRGLHSTHMGSGNHTIVFGEDYLELLGVVAPRPHNEAMRRFLAEREGLERIAFTTTDAEAGAEALRARGLEADGPIAFGRPVPMPGGGEAEARFSVIQWPPGEAPGGVRIFACQHHTRETVWVPELQRHPNGASRIKRALIATERPAGAASHLARLIGSEVGEERGFHLVPTAPSRAAVAFAPRILIARSAGIEAAALPVEGGAGVVLGTSSPRPPAFATGTAILFEAP